MEVLFKSKYYECLDCCLWDPQNGEETLEIRIPDGMPDIGRILAAWGQPILRGKEWRSEQILFSGGMMVWVLYAPEDETRPRCIEGWIPFSMRWDLPSITRDGQIRFDMKLRFVDARSVSPRKIMVRGGLAVMPQALIRRKEEIMIPDGDAEGIELLQGKYPVRLRKEAGEKSFVINEELTLPGSAPQPDKLLYYTVSPEVTEQKIIANKIIIRGNGNLHLLYAGEDGQLHNWDFPLNFSQYGELEEGFGNSAQPDANLLVTSLELNLDDEGILRLKCGLVGQYVIEEEQILEVVSDAYVPGRTVSLGQKMLDIPVVLDARQENLYGEQKVPAVGNIAVDANMTVDYPRQREQNGGMELEFPCSLQILYYDENGALQSAKANFQKQYLLRCDAESRISASLIGGKAPEVSAARESMEVSWELPVKLTTMGSAHIQAITGIEVGPQKERDQSRPSLVLKRAGDRGLWTLAKETASTVAAIRAANNLEEEPSSGQMLLIPVME